MELDLDKMPKAVESGVEIGEITTNETAFDKKTLVVTGAGDQQSAALGVGVVSPGIINCTTGTGSFILAYLEEPKFDPHKRVLCSCHAIPRAWVQEASIFTSGATLRWFRDQVGQPECLIAGEGGRDPYDIMTAEAEKSPIGANGLILTPHLVGAGAPYWNPFAKGVIFGLALGQKRRDLYRAVLEGVAFEVKKNIEIFKEIGIEPKELLLTGGGSRSDFWNQIYADVLGINCVRNKVEEATSLGAAILAATGAGLFKSMSEASKTLCKVDKKWIPNEENYDTYNRIYEFSNGLYDLLQKYDIYKDFNGLINNLKIIKSISKKHRKLKKK